VAGSGDNPVQLEVRNLTTGIKKGQNYLKVRDNVSFTIDEGEIVGLAGESGCGKSITALSVSGLLPDCAEILDGEIIYNGKSLTHLNENDMCLIRGKEISVIFQETRQSLNPVLKIGKQITETLELEGSNKLRNRKKNKSTALEMLFSLGFSEPEKVFNFYPHQLSGGMCQRVMAAIACIRRPRLLLADEPSSSLDEESQNNILSLLLKMNREHKMSMLVISHDLSIIMKFCSRYLVMYKGKIIEEGRSSNFYSPLHPYTKALIMAIPDKNKRGKKLENIPGKVPSIEDSDCGCSFAPRCKKAQNVCFESFPPEVIAEGHRVFCYFPEKKEVFNV
jgi:peptide/nickel transport system ATP-binding protein